MKVIYKYRLPFMEKSKVSMPQDAMIIRVDGFEGAIWIWAVVDTDKPLVDREFNLYKTGGEMPEDIHLYTYHGCGAIFVQMQLMMYVFENWNYTPKLSKPVINDFDWKAVQEN